MSMQASNVVSLIYFIAVLVYLCYALYKFCKTILFLYRPYTSSSSSGSLKIRNGQWKRFIAQISGPKSSDVDSDSNNELNAQKRAYGPTSFKEWTKCLACRYHPLGTLFYMFGNKQKSPLPISAVLSLFLTSCYHWLLCLLYALIMFAGGTTVTFAVWLGIAIPCALVLLVCGYAVIIVLRRLIRAKVTQMLDSVNKSEEKTAKHTINRKESVAELFLKGGPANGKNEADSKVLDHSQKLCDVSGVQAEGEQVKAAELENHNNYVAGEKWIRMTFLIGCVLASVCMGFTISTSNTLSSTSVQHYLITYLLSWGFDLLLFRVCFVLILATIFSRSSNMVTDCNELQVFEFWAVPAELEPSHDSVSRPAKQDVSAASSTAIKDWHCPSTDDRHAQNAFDDTKTEQSRSDLPPDCPKDHENHLETVRDDVEGENLASVNSPQKTRNAVGAGAGADKENGSLDNRARMLWGFHDMFSSKQTSPMRSQRPDAKQQSPGKTLSPIKGDVSFAAKEVLSPHKKLNALVYCSPLKNSMKVNQPSMEGIAKTSPKRQKRTFVYDENADSPYIEKYAAQKKAFEDPELLKLVRTIKDNDAKVSKADEHTAVIDMNANAGDAADSVPPPSTLPKADSGPVAEGNVLSLVPASLPEGQADPVVVQETCNNEPKANPAPQDVNKVDASNTLNNDANTKHQDTELHQKHLADSMVVIEGVPCPEENIEESTCNNRSKKGDMNQLFRKCNNNSTDRESEMRQISLFSRHSELSNDQTKLMLESIVDMKQKLPPLAKSSVPHAPSKGPKETVLDVSDFDANIDQESAAAIDGEKPARGQLQTMLTVDEEQVSSGTGPEGTDRTGRTGSQNPSSRDQRTIIAVQKAKLKKLLRIAETHERTTEAGRIKELLEQLKNTKKPVRRKEMRELEMLEALDLPYATRNSIPVPRPLSNDKYSSGSSARSKSRGKSRGRPVDPARMNELYMVYSSARPKRLGSINSKKRYATQAEKRMSEEPAQADADGTGTVEIKRELPPLKAKGLGGSKKQTESDREEFTEEIVNNKHLAKIDKIIGQCFDKVRKSFNKLKPRQSSKNVDEYSSDIKNLPNTEHKHQLRLPRRSLSKGDAQLFKLAN